MNHDVFVLLFIGHVLGDFYFQSQHLAKSKESSIKKLWIHCLLYLFAMLLVIVPIFSWKMVGVALVVSLSHLIIDRLKFWLNKQGIIKGTHEARVFLIDQVLHGLVIATTVVYLSALSIESHYVSSLANLASTLAWEWTTIFSWILVLLLIVQPCSVTIRKVLNRYQPINPDEDQQVEKGIPNAGALIGIFERLFIFLMLSINQFTAIGFVLTAKSIARYNKISESPQFAEYYLLGTLLSTLLVIISYMVIF